LIEICLNERYSKGEHLSDNFPVQSGLKEGDISSPQLFNVALEYQ
jgi:hypothetical protein